LRNHAPDIAAMDLFVVPTIGFKLLYGFSTHLESKIQFNGVGGLRSYISFMGF
jgi:hypothetical protein